MRTDSVRLSDDFTRPAMKYIEENYGKEYVGYVKKGKKTENVQDAHEAIRPTSINRTPESVKEYSYEIKDDKLIITNGKFGKAIPYIGWGVTAAICIWDIADYTNTASEGKELLKQSLAQYFQEVKTELLCSTDQSIMGSISNWETDVKTNIVN